MASIVDRRLELHDLLESICEDVYFEPPTGKQLVYPCIIYTRDYSKIDRADNKPYIANTRYSVTVIDPDPDSEIVPKMEQLEKCSYDRHYSADGLNHDTFTLYY